MLIKCKECGHEISDKSTFCPSCGYGEKKKIGCLGGIGILIVAFIGCVLLLTWLGNSSEINKNEQSQESNGQNTKKQREKLDYSKPIFTTDRAIICGQGLLLDNRADHGIQKILSLWLIIWNRSAKVKELGCEEWKGGIRVDAKPMESYRGFVGVGQSLDGIHEFFTVESDLTNDIDGK